MQNIPDFNDSERWVVHTTLKERYSKEKEILAADGEVRLRPEDRELALCPILYWEDKQTHFVILKTGAERYRCQFFLRGHEQFGVGVQEFDNIADCVTTLLKMQADHAAKT